jgi:hypothetical protein
MKYRKLRIAWSVGCGLAALLLSVLWVRSYRTSDCISRDKIEISSLSGVVQFARASPPVYPGWLLTSDPVSDALGTMPSFEFYVEPSYCYVNVPHWLLMLMSTTFASIPWLRWRFSLRTLLIGMTVVAAILGLVIWAAR